MEEPRLIQMPGHEALGAQAEQWPHAEAQEAVARAASDTAPVSGLTHNHYKYPARFSPTFVRSAIEAFTTPGDLVLDPFVGGGTTAVEALALGRHFIGTDISSLATFVTETKTMLISEADSVAFRQWAESVGKCIDMRAISVDFATGMFEGYSRNIEGKRFWRIKKAVEQALATTIPMGGSSERLARCTVLRAAQWALDGRLKTPSVQSFREALEDTARTIIRGSEEFTRAVASHSEAPSLRVEQGRASQVHDVVRKGSRRPKLVLTSPPYPGVHVLYHRWQVDGRKETPAPFMIAGRLDGSGESYYTMGHRRNPGLKAYWSNLRQSLDAIASICTEETVLVQVVAFPEPEWQLPRYLEECEASGFAEMRLDASSQGDRLWRQVPGRRWYADQRGETPASREVVLFHQLVA